MMAGVAGILLRQVPAELLAGVKSGNYTVFGATIHSVKSGRIVGHLQETSALARLIPSGPAAIPGLLADAITITQNEQIKSALSVVQSLQIADLAMGAASIGVSIAGTAVILRKLSSIEEKLDTLQPQLAVLSRDVKALRRDLIDRDLTRLSTLVEQLDECWRLTDPEPEWRLLAKEFHLAANEFRRLAREAIAESEDPLVAIPFIDAYAIASMNRVTARLGSCEMSAASHAARETASDLAHLGKSIKLDCLVLSRAAYHGGEVGTAEWTTRLVELEGELRPIVRAVRQREAAVAGRAEMISHLDQKGVSGWEWLAAARSEQSSPLLYLPING